MNLDLKTSKRLWAAIIPKLKLIDYRPSLSSAKWIVSEVIGVTSSPLATRPTLAWLASSALFEKGFKGR